MHLQRSGIVSLDEFLGGGLVTGDNVLWVSDQRHDGLMFCRPFLGVAAPDRRLITLTGNRLGADDGVNVIDASHLGSEDPIEALESILLDPSLTIDTRLVIDGLDEVVARWGAPAAVQLYRRICPRLFDIGCLAYWTASRETVPSAAIEKITKIAQCVFDVRQNRLRIAKAEGRPNKLQGAMVEVTVTEGIPEVSREQSIGRVGEGIRRIRQERNLTQHQIAEMAGVTAAAISQAETGRRGLSLDTLVPLCESLGITLDYLLGTQGRSDYTLSRHDRVVTSSGSVALFDDPQAGVRSYLIRLKPDETGTPPFPHKGTETILVAQGLVLITIGDATPVVRAGDAVMVTTTPVSSWTNLGSDAAELFWVVT